MEEESHGVASLVQTGCLLGQLSMLHIMVFFFNKINEQKELFFYRLLYCHKRNTKKMSGLISLRQQKFLLVLPLRRNFEIKGFMLVDNLWKRERGKWERTNI